MFWRSKKHVEQEKAEAENRERLSGLDDLRARLNSIGDELRETLDAKTKDTAAE